MNKNGNANTNKMRITITKTKVKSKNINEIGILFLIPNFLFGTEPSVANKLGGGPSAIAET